MSTISLRGATEHNLKGIDLDLPRNALIVVSGVSGSGKSSLVFDTIGREAQRRYLETFSSYARQFLGRVGRPSVRSISGLSPAIAIDQNATLRNPRSTVGTLTGLYDDLRLLFARLGSAPKGVTPQRRLFSFNSPHGACTACRGLGVEDRLDPALLVADPRKSIRAGALVITTPTGYVIYSQVTVDVLDQVCRAHGFDVDTPWKDLTDGQRHVVLHGSDRLRIPYGKHPLASRLRWSGITAKPREEGVYRGVLPVMEQILLRSRNRNILRFVRSQPCRACGGSRLKPEALEVRFRDRHIADFASMEVDRLGDECAALEWSGAEAPVGTPIQRAIAGRTSLLCQLGLGHLTLDRVSTTLSGGEAQRIRLASQVGSEMSGVLYVLDEPSIGLHPTEQRGLLGVLRTLRNRGNTVLVVEHDEETIRAADWLVDIGPGAGEQGGELLFSGTLEAFLSGGRAGSPVRPDSVLGRARSPSAPGSPGLGRGSALALSRTREFLLRCDSREVAGVARARRTGAGLLRLSGAARNNLRKVDAEFLLGALNVVTGVSGAGKSSLVEELVERVRRGEVEIRSGDDQRRARSPGAPGRVGGRAGSRFDSAHRVLSDSRRAPSRPDSISRVIHVDQSPIGRTPRSNPATYTGLSDVIRDLFAALPDSVARGYGKGRFSFNVAGGRCDACQGAGVQQVGMHFLGPVDVVCEACGGRRFNDDTLGIAYQGLNVHGMLDLTLDRATEVLSDSPKAARILRILCELGLGYLRLGQPSTTLSGGEAQRVKLAYELSRPDRGRTLYVLDEPTTGLHSADVEVLLAALTRLVEQGHTVVAIEHQPDVVLAADRVIDLGPGSGRLGGRVVATGTPEEVAGCADSLTGQALRARTASDCAQAGSLRLGPGEDAGVGRAFALDDQPILFRGVTTHNLSISELSIPANRVTVVTGVSGSGKSSFAFDTLYAEARNRFTESFSPYARRFLERLGDAEFESVSGLRPAVAVRQRAASRNPRSTVGTMTEIADHYRLLVSRAGEFPCPSCGGPAHADASPCGGCGWRSALPMTSTMFSPNAEQGACIACHGLGVVTECDPAKLVTQPDRSLLDGAMDGHRTGRFYGERRGQYMATLRAAGEALGIDFTPPWRDLDDRARDVAMRGAGEREFDVEWRYQRGTREGVHRFRSRWIGLVGHVGQEYARKHADRRGEALEPLMHRVGCAGCAGARLKPERLAVRVAGRSMADLLAMTVDESLAFLHAWDVPPRVAAIGTGIRDDVVARLEKLRDAGLGYLSLDRAAATLSAGEAQRVRLATEVTTGLTGVVYVLDEPTSGLHPRDTGRLLGLVSGLRDAGNTVVIVEHDLDVVRAADHVIDLGPGAGARGGRIVASGTPAEVAASPESPTGRELALRASTAFDCARARRTRPTPRPLRPGISLSHATLHNLRDLSVEIPAGGLVTVTGVSGSGKSTLVFDVLAPALASRPPGITVHEPFSRVVTASRDGLTPSAASTPATVMRLAGRVREAFASSDGARERGLDRRHFSTQTKGGRCEACEGAGRIRVSMDFLPDVWVRCDECDGRRFLPGVLACRLDGRSITDVLEMTVDEVAEFFGSDPAMVRPLRLLRELGLGYLPLGQGTDTLSGGERQRLVLAADLDHAPAGPALYLFDEPTTGLHAADVGRLLHLFDRLVAAGHTLIVVEHHLDVVRTADHVIDLGPEGGSGGGRIVAEGTPEEVARCAGSWTGAALRDHLQ